MMSDALKYLKTFNQFIVYQLLESAKRPGKLDKIPVDSGTGYKVSWQTSDNWMGYDEAEASATAAAIAFEGDYRVGFVISASIRLFCLDMDNCLMPDGQWSPLVHQIRSMLPDAAMERSVSGKGLHLWGRFTCDEPAHSCKNVALGLELYTDAHFMALGDADSAVGDASADCTAELARVIATYFQPVTTSATEPVWTDGPCTDDWNGPIDDAELIERAIRSRSAGASFGVKPKATFADLWTANVAVLSKVWPDAGGRPYDASSADAALAQHLAFWSGKDPERIRRIMSRPDCGLYRDKYDREDYLPRTIQGACSRQIEVCNDTARVDAAKRRLEQVEENMRVGEGSDVLPPAGAFTEDEMLTRYAYIGNGKQVIDLKAPQRIMHLDEWKGFYKASRTNVEVKGQYNRDGTQKVKEYETSRLWEMNPRRSQVDAVTFRPGAKLMTRDPEGRQAVNTWKPIERGGPPGDAALFLHHVDYLFGPDAPRFLDWLAHIEQHPGELPHTGYVQTSPSHGTGRNWLASVLCRLWRGYVAASFDLQGMFRTGFNGSLSRKLLAIVDEINEGGRDARWETAETLKSAVTVEERQINPKYGHQRVEFNACRWLIFSNHTSALPLGDDDRRFYVVRNELAPMAPEYYRELYAALKCDAFIDGVAEMLRTRDISEFNPNEPAPLSEAKRELVAASRTEADETLIQVKAFWPADVISSAILGELVTGETGGKLSKAHQHPLDRAKFRAYKATIKYKGVSTRVHIIRNRERWESAHPDHFRAELEKTPQIAFGQPRRCLDDLMAV